MGALSSLNPFAKPKIPTIQLPKAVKAAPTSADPAAQQASQDELQRLKKQRGRAATVLNKVQGDDSSGLATKTLLGG